MRLAAAISGVNSDTNPSPGVGIARSLRAAFPDARLIALDHSVRSSGLHHPVFDEAQVQPVWGEMDLPTCAAQIGEHLAYERAVWISGLDVEIKWLAQAVGAHPRLLAPTDAAQEMAAKPTIPAAATLGMKVPEWREAGELMELHQFGRANNWRLWVKGRYHEAYAAATYNELRRGIARMQEHWPIEDIFVQAHVPGLEQSYAFASYGGVMLDAVAVEKRSVTGQGKTWAAQVEPLAGAARERLEHMVKGCGWTGGGEVEFVRDAAGEDWLIDFNPRFPAYIHGITLCGHNLPGRLVAAALGERFVEAPAVAAQFIRTIEEIPVRSGLGVPRLLPSDGDAGQVGKHPSFQPELVRKLIARRGPSGGGTSAGAPARPWGRAPGLVATPYRYRDWEPLGQMVKEMAAAIERCAAKPRLVPAMSIKTDPHVVIAREFLQRGWAIEAISLAEVGWARAMGFDGGRIIYNGPNPLERDGSESKVWVAFADSPEALAGLAARRDCEMVGVRLRPGVRSRFGIDLKDWSTFERVCGLLEQNTAEGGMGVHMHIASAMIGRGRWLDCFEQTLRSARLLAETTGARITAFDIGGGWHSDDFRSVLLPDLSRLQGRIGTELPDVEVIIMEPGQAVSSDTAVLVTRIVEVRRQNGDVHEVVVDASISDLPMAQHEPHAIDQVREGYVLGALGGGGQRILGALCMEGDVVASNIAFAAEPRIGDGLLIKAAGGYNSSMAWRFGKGGRDE